MKLYFIRHLDSIGTSLIYDKKHGVKGGVIFCSFPIKNTGYRSYDRAFKRMVALSDENPDLNLDILTFEV